MAIELKQSLKLSQQLVMTPQLQQAIKLLQLNRMELVELVNQEMMENPVLDEEFGEAKSDSQINDSASEGDPESEQRRDEDAYKTEKDAGDKLLEGKDDFNWDSYIEEFNNYSSSAPSMREVNDELPSFESILTKSSTLEDHLTWQLSMANLTEQETKLGHLVIGNLSDAGYLRAPFDDIVKEAGMEIEDAEEVLKIIQNFDPIGCGSRDLRECLLLQSKFMNPRQPLAEAIIDNHLGELEKKNYGKIAKTLKVPLEKVIESIRLIMELEPKPGRSFQVNDTHYITPDIYVYKVGADYAIVLNEDGMPKLRISPYYKKVLSGVSTKDKKDKEYVQDKLRSAMWLIRSIHNRQKTIYKVTEAIVKRQRDFFEKGVQHLRPMVLRDVANDIGMHESTISRVTTNKYVHTPVGIFELKYFFNSKIGSTDGSEALASESVKDRIRQLVSKEDPKRPLSDQKLVEILSGEQIHIARRTVAKYREMLGILSSSKRKRLI